MKNLYVLMFTILALGFIGCAAPFTPTPNVENGELMLSGTLKRNCTEFSGSPSVGDKAIDFALKDIHGTEFKLSQFLAEKPVVMVFGSYT